MAERAGAIALQTHQRLVGVVENMSWLELPDGSRMEIFGAGGGATVAESLTRLVGAQVPLLGQIPLDTRVRESGDAGKPIVLDRPDRPGRAGAAAVADRLAVRRESLLGKPLGLRPARSALSPALVRLQPAVSGGVGVEDAAGDRTGAVGRGVSGGGAAGGAAALLVAGRRSIRCERRSAASADVLQLRL